MTAAATAQAALTPEACKAKKLKESGNLRKCQVKFDDKLGKLDAQATAAAIACRYGVNTGAEAGTVTDYDTGLQWEQKTDDNVTVHDKDNTYTWNTVPGGTTPNGTAFTAFLGTLNNGTSPDGVTTTGCFAGHCDWRLPAIGELAGIVDTTQGNCGGGSGPCIDQTVFGPTVGTTYWSASTLAGSAGYAWFVGFFNGKLYNDSKGGDRYVRGVRSGL